MSCPTVKRLTFNDLLKERDPHLFGSLENIKKYALEEWLPLIPFDKGSHTGYPHLVNVERNVDKIVPDVLKKTFHDGEIFLLLAAVYLHDIGKIEGSKNHHLKSKEIIQACWAELGLPDERIAEYCAVLAFFHAQKTVTNSKLNIQQYASRFLDPYGMLRIPMLAAVLRLADEAENSWKRTIPLFLVERLRKNGVGLIKGFRKYVEDVEFCMDSEAIICHLPKIVPAMKKIKKSASGKSGFQITGNELSRLNRLPMQIDGVLKEWGVILDEYGLKYKRTLFDHENKLYHRLAFNKQSMCEKSGKGLAHIFPREGNRPGVRELVDAILSLSMGSMRFNRFGWKNLEAKVGVPLNEREIWLVRRINMVSRHLTVHIHPDDVVTVEFSTDKIGEIKRELGLQ